MAHFRGIVRGSRSETSRFGSKDSGLRTVAATWAGAVEVRLYEHDGEDWAQVSLIHWNGGGVERILYNGPVNGAPPGCARLDEEER